MSIRRHPLVIPVILAVTLFAVLMMMVFSLYKINSANHRIDVNTAKIQANSERSCEAIRGAVEFWKIVRATTIELLEDPILTPTERRTNEKFRNALTKVINTGSQLPCGEVK